MGSCSLYTMPPIRLPLLHPSSPSGRWAPCRLIPTKLNTSYIVKLSKINKTTCRFQVSSCLQLGSGSGSPAMTTSAENKVVWIWTKNKQVLTSAVERGWNTFVFDSDSAQLARDWSSIALINPLHIKEGIISDSDSRSVASFFKISSPQNIEDMFLTSDLKNAVVQLLDWQVIPAENMVAAFQGNDKSIFAVAETTSEAQNFLEALEHGLSGIVLKVEEVDSVVKLKDYFDRRSEARNRLTLINATITQVRMAGVGDRVCVDLCTLLKPGEGLLVGSFARGLFLIHSECLETDYIASRPFRVNAGPVHAYIAVPGGKTCYLSELKTGTEVIVVDQNGQQRTAIVGRVKIETRPLVLIEAKANSSDQTFYSILLQNAETVAFVSPYEGLGSQRTATPVTSLKVGDEVLLRLQGGARHTGIEIQEFIVEK